MRCDFLRSAATGIGLVMAMSMAPAPARCQQADEASQQQPHQSLGKLFDFDRWSRLTPEERERELAKLPPKRAQWVRQQLYRYNRMSPAQKEQFRERARTFLELPPDQQQLVRERLREFRALPVPRQLAVHREVVALRALPQDQRAARLESDEIRSSFSAQERQIIRDLAEYLDIQK